MTHDMQFVIVTHTIGIASFNTKNIYSNMNVSSINFLTHYIINDKFKHVSHIHNIKLNITQPFSS
jgi:hypothetical protein